jgi:hypothetical protein
MNTYTPLIVIGMVALLIDVGLIYYSYRILKIADYITLWKRSWIYFTIAMTSIVVHRVFDLFGVNINNYFYSLVSNVTALLIAVSLLLFIYNISQVFKHITDIEKRRSSEEDI